MNERSLGPAWCNAVWFLARAWESLSGDKEERTALERRGRYLRRLLRRVPWWTAGHLYLARTELTLARRAVGHREAAAVAARAVLVLAGSGKQGLAEEARKLLGILDKNEGLL